MVNGLIFNDSVGRPYCAIQLQAFAEEDGKEVKFMRNIVQMLRLYFTIAADKAFPGLPDFPVLVTPTGNPKFGDYQCNVAPPLAGVIKLFKSH
jgi:hypothetical protein